MKRILAVAVTSLLVATAAVKAAPPLLDTPGESAAGLTETVQFKKGKGRGFKKGAGFKRGGHAKGKGPQCFNKCVANGKSAMQCQGRCR